MSIFSGLFRSRDKPKDATSGSSYRFFFGGTTVAAIQKLNPTLIKNVNLIITGWKIRVK